MARTSAATATTAAALSVFATAATGEGSPITLSWYAAIGQEGSKVPVIGASGQVTTVVEAGKAYPLPAELFGASFIAAVASAGTVTIVIAAKG
jgi:hypothetical protein